jgi:trans-aconitate 2-methyltransferase
LQLWSPHLPGSNRFVGGHNCKIDAIFVDPGHDVAVTSWDPSLYGRYADERSRPFFDLVERIGTPAPATIVDLGCGPGTLTATLAGRWPDAQVLGIDSSEEMIAAAAGQAIPGRVGFRALAIEEWQPSPVDVIVANASLQWVPDHDALLPRWAAALRPGGALAFQVPKSRGVPAGEIFKAVARSRRWASRLAIAAEAAGPRSAGSPVREGPAYADLLARLGLRVDAWETTYFHILPGADPVLEWFSGTGLRPYLDALRHDDEALAEFRAEVGELLRGAYPRAPYGTILPFPRIFVVAHRT